MLCPKCQKEMNVTLISDVTDENDNPVYISICDNCGYSEIIRYDTVQEEIDLNAKLLLD